MGFSVLLGFFVCLQLLGGMSARDTFIYDNYQYLWGPTDHFMVWYRGREVELFMDKTSGAGFVSKLWYGSGFFHMRIKLPGRNTADVITTFYLTSGENAHDELDFEFLGNTDGRPILLQTNVFANGVGEREQRITLWFDPTAHYHDYKILWNHHQIVFYVDDTPIRVFKNNGKLGIPYPSQPMQIQASIWHADWGTGDRETDWSSAPFKAQFQGFDISGCNTTQASMKECYGHNYWWNNRKFWDLDNNELEAYEKVRRTHMQYDYCTDNTRVFKSKPDPRECSINSLK